jgi:cytochrome b
MKSSEAPPPAERRPILVWDLPVRLFHWLLVLLVTASALSGSFAAEIGGDGMQWHKRCGYCILALVLFRAGWGFFGSTYARFANFVRGPRAVARYAAGLLRPTHETHAGHNPLGGWSVVSMLLALGVQTTTGLFISDEDLGVEGPLAHLVSSRTGDLLASVHEINFYVLLALVATHIAAILFYLLVKRENLVRPMLTGYKQLPPRASPAGGSGMALRAAALLLVAAATVYWIARN